MVCSFASYFLFVWILDDNVYVVQHHFTFRVWFYSPLFYIIMFIVVMSCFLVNYVLRCIAHFIYTDTRDIVRRQAVNRLPADDPDFLEQFNQKLAEQKHLSREEDRIMNEQIDIIREERLSTKHFSPRLDNIKEAHSSQSIKNSEEDTRNSQMLSYLM